MAAWHGIESFFAARELPRISGNLSAPRSICSLLALCKPWTLCTTYRLPLTELGGFPARPNAAGKALTRPAPRRLFAPGRLKMQEVAVRLVTSHMPKRESRWPAVTPAASPDSMQSRESKALVCGGATSAARPLLADRTWPSTVAGLQVWRRALPGRVFFNLGCGYVGWWNGPHAPNIPVKLRLSQDKKRALKKACCSRLCRP